MCGYGGSILSPSPQVLENHQANQCPPPSNLSPEELQGETVQFSPAHTAQQSTSSPSLLCARPCGSTQTYTLISSTEQLFEVGLFDPVSQMRHPPWRAWIIGAWWAWEETPPGGLSQYHGLSSQMPRFLNCTSSHTKVSAYVLLSQPHVLHKRAQELVELRLRERPETRDLGEEASSLGPADSLWLDQEAARAKVESGPQDRQESAPPFLLPRKPPRGRY